MKRRTTVAIYVVLSAAALGLVARAQDKTANTKGGEKGQVEVKQYADMSEGAVFRLAQLGKVNAVRFKATFKELLRPKPDALDLFRIGRTTIDPILIFETQGEIVGLITRKDLTLLRRTVDLVRGQEIIVEGTVIPEHAGYKMVIVDDIKFNMAERRDVQWEVLVHWPGEKPKLIRMPGTYTLDLPVPANLKDNRIKFQIEVRRVREFNKAGTAEK